MMTFLESNRFSIEAVEGIVGMLYGDLVSPSLRSLYPFSSPDFTCIPTILVITYYF